MTGLAVTLCLYAATAASKPLASSELGIAAIGARSGPACAAPTMPSNHSAAVPAFERHMMPVRRDRRPRCGRWNNAPLILSGLYQMAQTPSAAGSGNVDQWSAAGPLRQRRARADSSGSRTTGLDRLPGQLPALPSVPGFGERIVHHGRFVVTGLSTQGSDETVQENRCCQHVVRPGRGNPSQRHA
jgi:hypothetical protein